MPNAIYTAISDRIAGFIAKYKESTADGTLSLAEIFNLTNRAIADFAVAVEVIGGAGEDKKAAVLLALGDFYDQIIKPYNIPGVPDILENTIVDPYGRTVFISIVDGLIDGMVRVFNKTKVFAKPTPSAADTPAGAPPMADPY